MDLSDRQAPVPENDSTLIQVWKDLRQRKVFRVAAAYGVIAWILVESSSVVLPALLLPEWTVSVVVLIALVGFPITLFLTWLFDITDRGLERTATDGHRSERAASRSLKVIYAVAGVIAVAVIAYVLQMFPAVSDSIPRHSIAVLPFIDLSEGQDSEYFGDGIAEELLNSLVGVSGLRVAARTSSFAFKGRETTDVRDIGRELNVATVLEGSVRRQGDRIRITAQLINVEDGFHLWSQSYDRRLDDIFELQDEIARAIVDALRPELIGDVEEPLLRAATTSIRAYDLYLEGRHLWHQRTGEALERALLLFEEAVTVDDGFALAYTGIADSYLLLEDYGHMEMEQAVRKAEPAIARALTLDSQLPEAYASLGLMRFKLDDRIAAELALRKAIELNPNYSMAHMWLGLLLRQTEGLRAALPQFERASEIDPLHPVINRNLAGTLANMGRYEEARDRVTRVLEQQESPGAFAAMADIAEMYGHFDESIAMAFRALDLESDNAEAMARLARSFANLGDFGQANEWVVRLGERSQGEKAYHAFTQFYVDYLSGDIESLVANSAAELDRVRSAETDDPYDVLQISMTGMAYVVSGDFEEGSRLLQEALASDSMIWHKPEMLLTVQTMLAHAYRAMDQEERANTLLDGALDRAARARVDGWDDPRFNSAIIAALACRGRLDEAVNELRGAVDRGWKEYWYTVQSPLFDQVRQLPEFKQVMAEVKREIDRMKARVDAIEAERASQV